MRLVVFAFSICWMLGGCAGESGATSSLPAAVTGEPGMSVSTDGWVALFDGTSTDAFRAYGEDDFPRAGWAVEDDALLTVPGSPVDLITRETFQDFEFAFAWRVTPGGNGGVMIRVVESDQPSWTSGPEYQVLDDAGHPDGARPETSAAALYDLIAPAPDKVLQPVGEFNAARIVVRDGHVEHWLNDVRVLEYDWDTQATLDLIAASKFRDLPAFMRADAGHIVLQHHGEAVAYRDIRIRPLSPAPEAPPP